MYIYIYIYIYVQIHIYTCMCIAYRIKLKFDGLFCFKTASPYFIWKYIVGHCGI